MRSSGRSHHSPSGRKEEAERGWCQKKPSVVCGSVWRRWEKMGAVSSGGRRRKIGGGGGVVGLEKFSTRLELWGARGLSR